MDASKRIVINTLAQHLRSIANICLSLYSTRLVLQALGQSDFGIFSLVGGVVAMLGFITNAMVVATQRHLSFHHGKGNMGEVRRIFANSLFLHISIGVSLAAIILIIEPLLFNGFLKIEPTRIEEASVVYKLMVASLFLTFMAAPYKALFIARENIVYISIVEVTDGILKLLCAIWLLYWNNDRLIAYAFIMTAIMGFNYLAFFLYARCHFPESMFLPERKHIDRKVIYQIFDFAGWTVYSMGCIIGRVQGVAIIFNRFFGTVINSSYGIAMQVSAAIHFVAQAVVNAMSPQVFKSEGMGDRQRMLALAEATSKYAYLLMAMAVIPVVFEMDEMLTIWLGEVPEQATMLCQMMLLTSLVDQSTIGLGIANQAIGRIRNYSLCINTIKILTLPIMFLCLWLGYSISVAMWCYFIIELAGALCRLIFLKLTAGLSIRHFSTSVFLGIMPPTLLLIAGSWIVTQFVVMPLRFMFTAAFSIGLCVPVIWFATFNSTERAVIVKILNKKK